MMGENSAKFPQAAPGFEYLKQNYTMPISFVATSTVSKALGGSVAQKRRPIHPFSELSLARPRKKQGPKHGGHPKCQETDEKAFAVPFSYPSMAIRFPVTRKSLFGSLRKESYICIFHSGHERPLDIWDKQIRGGTITRVSDCEQQFSVLEITGKSPFTFIIAPICPTHTLGIRLPFIVLDVKNLDTFFEYQVEILDFSKVRRVFKFTTTAIGSKVTPFSCTIPCKLVKGWNQVIFNLAHMTRAVFKSTYKEAVRVQVHANCRLRRVYFCERPGRDHCLHRHQNLPEVDGHLSLAASHSAIEFSSGAAGGDIADVEHMLKPRKTSGQMKPVPEEQAHAETDAVRKTQDLPKEFS